MTREEEINNAIETYMNGLFEDGVEIAIEDYENLEDAFEAGAEWADSHPNSPWVSVEDDLPCNHKELLEDDNHTTKMLVRMRHNKYKICIMGNKEGSVDTEWHWRSSDYKHITHWMPITKLPK